MKISDIAKMSVGPDGVIQGFRPRFRKLDEDWEDYLEAIVELERMGKLTATPGVALYHSHGTPGMDWLTDQYFQKALWAEIEAYHLPDGGSWFETMYSGTREACERLVEHGEAARARRIWRAHVAGAKSHFWSYIIERDRGFRVAKNWIASEEEQRAIFDAMLAEIPAKKKTLLAVLEEWRDFAVASGATTDDLQRIGDDIAMVTAEARPKPSGPPDRRKMDEALFWDLIGDPETPVAERLETLPDRLAPFSATAIRTFDKILREKDALAYRSDVWALAYMLQGGCSDDAFEQFRGWLILQGRAVFDATLADPDGFDIALHSGTSSGMDGLRDAGPLAFEQRAGKAMPATRAPALSLTGPDWDEDGVADVLPNVAQALRAS